MTLPMHQDEEERTVPVARITAMENDMGLVKHDLAGVDARQKDVLEWINGNGKPGAKEKLALLEKGLCDLNKSMADLMSSMRTITTSIVVAIIIFLLTTGIPAIVGMVQHLGRQP